ncbi:MAG TPA: M56 family metallopeptidase [Puia sp.]|jgi:beta-lactamase regulating signal transducer with metallopeptidase domain|nr:M56 family metallopeptidase [Puia sp.]
MIQAICWVLVHSLWQGLLLALAGGAVILSTKRAAAALRYRVLCGLSGVFLAGMGLTFYYEWTIIPWSGNGSDRVGAVRVDWLEDWCSAHAVQIVGAWLIVTLLKSVRMAAGFNYIRRIRRQGLISPALWVERVQELSRQLGVRRPVRMVESALLRVPIVIGQLRPVIYIPLGLINHLPASEMEAVLLHELAHIRRYDHVVNMVQQVAECLLFFNPGFLWISSVLREERENCCDDMAIEHTRDRVEYVRALVRFKEHSLRGMALAFPGNKRQLLHRVMRISRQENKTLSGKERLVLLGGCLALLCLLAAIRPSYPRRSAKDRPVEVQLVKSRLVQVPANLVAVLQERQQVAQNMEWVQTQLVRLRHRSGAKRRNATVKKSEHAQNPEQAERDQRQADQQRTEAELRAQADQQAQADLNRLQADRDRDQAARDREQAERDRRQAEQDRLQAVRDRQQADRDRAQAELYRQQADRDRAQAELNRQQAELNRIKAERDRQKTKNN